MYCAAFIWEPGTYDEEFHRLNAAIEKIALSISGYLGSETWQNSNDTKKCANYFWSDRETLKTFSEHPLHQEAKKKYANWYNSYHIIISEVIRSYGDGNLSHITPNKRN